MSSAAGAAAADHKFMTTEQAIANLAIKLKHFVQAAINRSQATLRSAEFFPQAI